MARYSKEVSDCAEKIEKALRLDKGKAGQKGGQLDDVMGDRRQATRKREGEKKGPQGQKRRVS